MGRLIPAGTGFAHHAERRRTREQDLADQLRELEEAQAAEAAAAAVAEAGADAVDGDAEAEATVVGEAEAEATVVGEAEAEATPAVAEKATDAEEQLSTEV